MDGLIEFQQEECDHMTESKTTLEALLEKARNHVMTAAEIREQRISFTYGMLPFSSTLTKDDVRKLLERNGL